MAKDLKNFRWFPEEQFRVHPADCHSLEMQKSVWPESDEVLWMYHTLWGSAIEHYWDPGQRETKAFLLWQSSPASPWEVPVWACSFSYLGTKPCVDFTKQNSFYETVIKWYTAYQTMYWFLPKTVLQRIRLKKAILFNSHRKCLTY